MVYGQSRSAAAAGTASTTRPQQLLSPRLSTLLLLQVSGAASGVLPLSTCHPTPLRVPQPVRLCATAAAAPPSIPAAMPSSSVWVASLGDGVHGAEAASAVYAAFAELAASAEFATETWARRPMLRRDVPGVARSFTLEHLAAAVDGDFLDAGRGIAEDLGDGGWKMAAVSQPRGSSFEDAKMRYVDVQKAMEDGTVVFNSAGAHISRLGSMCLAALDAFGLPNCLNLYVTAKGCATSAPPHTDKQDVFVLQSGGAKRWRVYTPPPPDAKPHADPLARGKAHDALRLDELAAPLLDVVLRPGDMLYVPAGFPHTTDTVHTAAAGAAADEDSIHLTIGLDTHIWGLDYAGLRRGALARLGLPDALTETTLGARLYWRLIGVPACLGFLRGHVAGHVAAPPSEAAVPSEAADPAERAAAVRAAVVAELVACARAAEPFRWGTDADEAKVGAALEAEAVAAQCEQHAARVIEVQRAMYLDAARDVRPSAPGMPRVSLFRVREHLARLEKAMEAHLEWYGPEAVARARAAAEAAAASLPGRAASAAAGKPKKGMAKAGGGGSGMAAGGFGGGVGSVGGGGAKKKKR
jgi:uncharacterized membrane protein YgcG